MIAGEGKGKAGRGPMDEGTNCLTFVDSVRVAPKIDPTVSATVFALRKPLVDLQATERFSTARPQRSKRPPKTATRHMYHKYLQHIYKYILNKPFER